MSGDYPRVLATAIGIFPTDRYHAVLYRVGGDLDAGAVYTELARCRHLHRNRRKALECAETLAALDGAPQV